MNCTFRLLFKFTGVNLYLIAFKQKVWECWTVTFEEFIEPLKKRWPDPMNWGPERLGFIKTITDNLSPGAFLILNEKVLRRTQPHPPTRDEWTALVGDLGRNDSLWAIPKSLHQFANLPKDSKCCTRGVINAVKDGNLYVFKCTCPMGQSIQAHWPTWSFSNDIHYKII